MSKVCINNADCRGLTQTDLIELGQYVYLYKQHIGNYFGRFDWDDVNFKQLCKTNKIQPKGNNTIKEQHNHFWFSANKTENGNDVAHHFLRHVRNAFAHGNIAVIKESKAKSKYFLLQDFETKRDGTIIQTMQGKIRCELLWLMIDTLYHTFK